MTYSSVKSFLLPQNQVLVNIASFLQQCFFDWRVFIYKEYRLLGVFWSICEDTVSKMMKFLFY